MDYSLPYDKLTGDAEFLRVKVWRWPVRLFHWLNALAITVLFFTGIYITFIA